MPKFVAAVAAVAGIGMFAALSATTANAQMGYMSNVPIEHDFAGVDRVGNLCWVDTDLYKEMDVHGYWRVCEPGAVGPRHVVLHRHRIVR